MRRTARSLGAVFGRQPRHAEIWVPAPYLASRGMKWIQHYEGPRLTDEELKEYLCQFHRIDSLGLSKERQREFGLSWLIGGDWLERNRGGYRSKPT